MFTRDTRDPFNFGNPADAGSLLIEIGGTSDSIKIYCQYAVNNDLSGGIDRFEFADGTVLNRAQIDELVNPGNQIVGTDGAETLTGTAANERSSARRAPTACRATTATTPTSGISATATTHREFNITSIDVVSFGIGIRPQDITLSHIGEFGRAAGLLSLPDLRADRREAHDGVGIQHHRAGAVKSTIEEFRFADGTVWTQNTILAGFLGPRATTSSTASRGPTSWTAAPAMTNCTANRRGHLCFRARLRQRHDLRWARRPLPERRRSHPVQQHGVVRPRSPCRASAAPNAGNGRVIDTVFSIAGTTDKLIVAGGDLWLRKRHIHLDHVRRRLRILVRLQPGRPLSAAEFHQRERSDHRLLANEVINTGLGNDTLDGGRGTIR